MKDYKEIKNIICLIDVYGCLLNEKQFSYLEDYFFNDLSLSEIAKKNLVTKTAISNSIKQITHELKHYEEKLKLISKMNRINSIEIDHDCKIIKKIKEIMEII